MSYIVAQKKNPNNETRVTLYRQRAKRLSLIEQAAAALEVSVSEVACLAHSVPLGSEPLTFVSNSKPQRIVCSAHSYRRTRFGRGATTRIYHAGGALDRFDAERSHYLMMTATLPGDDEWSKFGIADNSHKLINRFKAWLSKRLTNRKEFYVWEHQKRGALHFHYCVHVPDSKIREGIKRDFKREWVRLLDQVSEDAGYSLWGKHAELTLEGKLAIIQCDVEEIYSSVASYLAGYVSGEGFKHANDTKHPYYPKRWFGVSRPLSALIASYSEEERDEFSSLREASEFYHAQKEYFLDESLTHREYPHKVGEGKTTVFYHTQEQQDFLWYAKMTLNHSQSQHPNIHALIQTVLIAIRDGSRYLKQSKASKVSLCPAFSALAEDSTYLVSLRRDAISQQHLRAIREQYSFCDLSTVSASQVKTFWQSLRRAETLRAKYHPQMEWNQYGWLKNLNDFAEPVDDFAKSGYARTSYEETERGDSEVNLAVNHEHTHTEWPLPTLTSPPPKQQSIWGLEKYLTNKQDHLQQAESH